MKNKKLIIGVIIIIAIVLFIDFFIKDKEDTEETARIEEKVEEVTLSEEEVQEIAEDKEYEIEDEDLKVVYDDLLADGTVIVAEKNAENEENAKKLFEDFQEEVNEYLDIVLEETGEYSTHSDYEYVNLVETDFYYMYIGEYTYEFVDSPNEEFTDGYSYLIFKSSFIENLTIKSEIDADVVQKFGDILTVLQHGQDSNSKIIDSAVEEDDTTYLYTSYYIVKSYIGEEESSITEESYYYIKTSFTVDKSTGETNLVYNEVEEEYLNSYCPDMNYETLNYFTIDL